MAAIRTSRGYSLVELLVILAIIGILAVAGASYRMDRKGPAVKGSVNAIYGCLAQAQKMARSSGKTVALTTSGTGNQAILRYGVPDTIGGTASAPVILALGQREEYNHASDASAARYSLVENDFATPPASTALTDLFSNLSGTKMGDNTPAVPFFPSQSSCVNMFTTKTSFDSQGLVDSPALAVVVGTTQSGTRVPNGPVGIILVTRPGSIFRYYCSDASAQPIKWVRL